MGTGTGHRVPLPPGVSPVTAGRLGLWLLAGRSRNAKIRRDKAITRGRRGPPRTPLGRVAEVLCQWHVSDYPGPHRLLGHLMGISPQSAARLFRPGKHLPRDHAHRLALYLDQHIAAAQTVRDEMRALANRPSPRSSATPIVSLAYYPTPNNGQPNYPQVSANNPEKLG